MSMLLNAQTLKGINLNDVNYFTKTVKSSSTKDIPTLSEVLCTSICDMCKPKVEYIIDQYRLIQRENHDLKYDLKRSQETRNEEIMKLNTRYTYILLFTAAAVILTMLIAFISIIWYLKK